MHIRTKIVATVGPACATPAVLEQMVRAGVDVFRINFSHGQEATRASALEAIRRVERRLGEPLAVMADLCGPKIRVGPIVGGSVLLGQGAELTIRRRPVQGSARAISTTLPELVDNVEPGQTLLLDDGKIRLRALEVRRPDEIICRVTAGGVLASGKGVNLPQTELRLPALTEKDRRDVDWIARNDFDLVALSFVQRAEDLAELRALLPEDMRIVAKIEKPQALARIESILAATDALMVARGDLGVEMPLPQVPLEQKRLVELCRSAGKACIVATQMLESMIDRPGPTRAEAADIANAVLDGADALMLSAETAVGKNPVEAVKTMNDIAAAAEDYELTWRGPARVSYAPSPTTSALAAAVRAVIEQESIAAVAVFTATGTTAAVLAQHRLAQPILAMSPSQRVVRQMNLLFGVQPVRQATPQHTRQVIAAAAKHLKAKGLVRRGQKIVVLSGRPIGQPGTTNTLVVHRVG
ncbi:MAG: pyruvate kinase [Planctomycetales bacterium 4484_123]|nr:MAG: pyruvate kinase [Planctomycetales bacterium 4484_123]